MGFHYILHGAGLGAEPGRAGQDRTLGDMVFRARGKAANLGQMPQFAAKLAKCCRRATHLVDCIQFMNRPVAWNCTCDTNYQVP